MSDAFPTPDDEPLDLDIEPLDLDDEDPVALAARLEAVDAAAAEFDRVAREIHALQVATTTSALIASIRPIYRRRRVYHRVEKSLILQRNAQERWAAVERIRAAGGELPKKKFPKPTAIDIAEIAVAYPEFAVAEAQMKAKRKKMEKYLEEAAQRLPVYATFVKPLYGMGALGLAIIVGEAGDLGAYPNPAKLWKRMGVGLVPTDDGELVRQRRTLDKELALKMGFDPTRRSALFTIGDSLVKAEPATRSKDKELRNLYRELYLAKRAEYRAREDFRSLMQAHRRAQRFMEKRLLRDLWGAWRETTREVSPNAGLSPAAPPEADAVLPAA